MGSISGIRPGALFFSPFLEHLLEFFGSVNALLEKKAVHRINSCLEAFITWRRLQSFLE